MATISNTPRPGYVWDATDNVWYPIGTGSHDHNEIQKSIVDAKGDIIAATAADTVSRLAVGSNDQVLTADSSTATGLKWATPGGPAFRAFRNTSQQSFSQNTWTKVQFNGETFDTDSCFDSTTNYRFTPNKAGYYEMHGLLLVNKTGASYTAAQFYKNGSALSYLYQWTNTGTQSNLDGTDLIYMNGSTDYLEIFVYDSDPSGRGIIEGSNYTYFSGVWIRS